MAGLNSPLCLMARPVNRKRTHKNKEPDGRSLWGSLFNKEAVGEEGEDFTRATTYSPHGDYEEEEELPEEKLFTLLRRKLWQRFNIWALISASLFLSFTLVLLLLLVKLWMPQNLSDIAGYNDTTAARDLTALIRNANGAPVTITEAELNRYLRDTCRMRQTGIFSIITHCQGLAVRIHNGYAELVFDRLMGANMHQTTAVYLTFAQENRLGNPELKAELRGSEPLLGTMPSGGSIGSVALPQRHVLMLKPALESLISCYPDIAELIREHHYCPVFSANGQDRRLTLIPYSAS